MNGRDVADAEVEKHYRDELQGLLEWITTSLMKKREREPLTPFERELLIRAEKIQEM